MLSATNSVRFCRFALMSESVSQQIVGRKLASLPNRSALPVNFQVTGKTVGVPFLLKREKNAITDARLNVVLVPDKTHLQRIRQSTRLQQMMRPRNCADWRLFYRPTA